MAAVVSRHRGDPLRADEHVAALLAQTTAGICGAASHRFARGVGAEIRAVHAGCDRVRITIRVMKSLQETYAPNNRCFGCGPSNEQGLRIRSFESGDEVVCDWTPQPHHLAFTGIVNGGIIGAILD